MRMTVGVRSFVGAVVLAWIATSCKPRKFNSELEATRRTQSEDALALAWQKHASTIERLQTFLRVDRFDAYVAEQRGRLGGKGIVGEPVLAFLRTLEPKHILASGAAAALYEDPATFDDTLLDLIGKAGINVSPEQFRWNYNFRKNKFRESYVVSRVEASFLQPWVSPLPLARSVDDGPTLEAPRKIPDLGSMTLDAAQYVANRMTRGAFWAPAQDVAELEFHVGDVSDFKERMAKSGAVIFAEIRPMANNYNKIYLVDSPSESKPRIAVTYVSGQSRLEHLLWHEPVARKSLGLAEGNPPARPVFGNTGAFLTTLERSLYAWMARQPRADTIVIGQHGRFQSMFLDAARVRTALAVSDGRIQKLEEGERKFLEKLREKAASSKSVFVNESSPQLGKLALALGVSSEVATSSLGRFETTAFNVEDFAYVDAAGKNAVLRVFSNVWGDEIRPIARAVSRAGTQKVFYIGTAGAFPNAGLKVGDVFIPDSFLGRESDAAVQRPPFRKPRAENAPAYVRTGGSVVEVDTPFREDKDWLKKQSRRGAMAVEVETFELAANLTPSIPLQVYLLVSDVLETEETLDSASSSKREKALEYAVSQIFDEIKAVGPGTGSAALVSEKALANLAPKLERELEGIGELLTHARLRVPGMSVVIEPRFFEFDWDRKAEAPRVAFVVGSPSERLDVETVVKDLAGRSSIRSQVEVAERIPFPGYVLEAKRLPSNRKALHAFAFEWAALRGAYLLTEGTTGRLKLLPFPQKEPWNRCPDLFVYCAAIAANR